MPFLRQAPIVFVIKSFISFAPKSNNWIIATGSDIISIYFNVVTIGSVP